MKITRTLALVSAFIGVTACTETGERRLSDSYWFSETATESGIDFEHFSGANGEFALPEITGGGVALLDVDNDSDLDIFLVQSGCLSEACSGNTNHSLYLNLGDGQFRESSVRIESSNARYGMGAATADYDNDGDVDIFVSAYGVNQLYQNNGSGHFVDVAEVAGVADPSWSTSATFADFDKDGYLDLYVTNYMHWNPSTQLDCSSTSIQTYCLPMHDYAAMDHIYRNRGDGTFEDLTLNAGLGSAFGNGLGVVANDFNSDGWIDIFVANDSMVNQLWINQGSFTFSNEAWLLGVAMDDHGIEKAGMGVISFDYEEDGDFDLIVVNIEGQTDSLYRNEGNYFSDATGISGLGATSRRYTRFGLLVSDFDNDGCIDLFQANGKVFHNEEDLHREDYFSEPNVLYQGSCDDTFSLVGLNQMSAQDHIHTSRGAAVGDINLDGNLDLIVVNRDAKPSLLIGSKNNTGRNWIRFRLLNERGRDDYNAVLSVSSAGRTIHRHVQTDGSYLSASEPIVHVGLGSATTVFDVTVKWLDGREEQFGEFKSNQLYTLNKGKGVANANEL